MPFVATWMDPEVLLSEEVKEKDKYHTLSLIRGIENMTQMNLSTKQTHRHIYSSFFTIHKGACIYSS